MYALHNLIQYGILITAAIFCNIKIVNTFTNMTSFDIPVEPFCSYFNQKHYNATPLKTNLKDPHGIIYHITENTIYFLYDVMYSTSIGYMVLSEDGTGTFTKRGYIKEIYRPKCLAIDQGSGIKFVAIEGDAIYEFQEKKKEDFKRLPIGLTGNVVCLYYNHRLLYYHCVDQPEVFFYSFVEQMSFRVPRLSGYNLLQMGQTEPLCHNCQRDWVVVTKEGRFGVLRNEGNYFFTEIERAKFLFQDTNLEYYVASRTRAYYRHPRNNSIELVFSGFMTSMTIDSFGSPIITTDSAIIRLFKLPKNKTCKLDVVRSGGRQYNILFVNFTRRHAVDNSFLNTIDHAISLP